MLCWYCHWGWPIKVANIYKEALERLNDNESPLRYGPARVVWDDENFDLAENYLVKFNEWRNQYDYTDTQLDVVKWSLEELCKLSPEDYEYPEDYDGDNPENYPPTFEVVIIQFVLTHRT